MVRNPSRTGEYARDQPRLVQADAFDAAGLPPALAGIPA